MYRCIDMCVRCAVWGETVRAKKNNVSVVCCVALKMVNANKSPYNYHYIKGRFRTYIYQSFLLLLDNNTTTTHHLVDGRGHISILYT